MLFQRKTTVCLKYFGQDCSKDKAHVELQSEANLHHRNRDTNEINLLRIFFVSFILLKEISLLIVLLLLEIRIFISWITISNLLSECQDNISNFTNDKGNVELQSEPDPHHTNEDTDEITSLGKF